MKAEWKTKGNFKDSIRLMYRYHSIDTSRRMKNIGKLYVDSLQKHTPKDTGELAAGWEYNLGHEGTNKSLSVHNNSHPEWGELMYGLEYGHATGTGGYVKGTHFITKSIDKLDRQVSAELGGVITDVK